MRHKAYEHMNGGGQRGAAVESGRLHAKQFLQALGLRWLAAGSLPAIGVRGTKDLPEVLVRGVGVARRLTGDKEVERVRRSGCGGEEVEGGGDARHLRQRREDGRVRAMSELAQRGFRRRRVRWLCGC